MKDNKAMLVTIVMMSFLVFHSLATDHMVGGSNSGRVYPWSFGNIGSFPFDQGTVIKPGDVLVFKYDNTKHNVVNVVTYSDYSNCQANPGKRWNSGYDRITLPVVGEYYFLSTFDKDCSEGGMRFGVYAGGSSPVEPSQTAQAALNITVAQQAP